MADATVTKGLLVRIEGKEGKEQDVQDFLEGDLELVNQEPDTTVWFAVRLGPSTFGIFDAFADDAGRDAHLSGKVAEALGESVGELIEAPQIDKVDVIATKLP